MFHNPKQPLRQQHTSDNLAGEQHAAAILLPLYNKSMSNCQQPALQQPVSHIPTVGYP
jgi:hypothetical protein